MKKNAFTLIELLASISILMVIVTIVGVVFTESDRAWTLGTNRSDNNLAARAALSMISHDLQYAVADDVLTFATRKDRWDISTFDFGCDETCFVSIQHDSSDDNRAAREVFYYIREAPADSRRYELMRGYYSGALLTAPDDHCYGNREWYEGSRPGSSRFIVKNITGFAVYVPGADGELTRDYYSYPGSPEFDSSIHITNRVPEYADICIEILPDREARQAADLWMRAEAAGAPPSALFDRAKEFVRDKSTRYATRVYFHNRDGYKER